MLARRPMLCFALSLIAGVSAARHHPGVERLLPYGAVLNLLAAVAVFFIPPRMPQVDTSAVPEPYREYIVPVPGFFAQRSLNCFMAVVCMACFLLGAWRQSSWRDTVSDSRLPEEQWFDATLLALTPQRDHPEEEGRWRVSALVLTINGRAADDIPVRLYGAPGELFRRGDVIQARVRRDAPGIKPFPGGFDPVLWLERDGLAGALSVVRPRRGGKAESLYTVSRIGSVSPLTSVRRCLDAIRAEAIHATLRHGGESGPMLAAMLYGYRKDLSKDIRDAFRRVGIGHVLAISGLHIGLVAWLLWYASAVVGWTARGRAVACLVLVLVYLGLTGGQVAATRAAIMAMIFLASLALGRRADMLNSLGAAAFLIALLNPSASADISFQLSFTAVFFIYLAMRRNLVRNAPDPSTVSRGRRRTRRRRVVQWLNSLVRLSFFTWIGLFPIIALVFNQVNIAGLPVNIAVIPLMSFVLAGGILAPWLGWIPGVGWLLRLPAKALTELALLADSIPYSSFSSHAPDVLWVIAFYAAFFLVALMPMIRRPLHRIRWFRGCLIALGVSAVGMLVSMRSFPPPVGGRITVLPGRDGGTFVAESEVGGIALVGTVARGGLAEARWLHYRHRDGDVAVVAVGSPHGNADTAALADHYALSDVTEVPHQADEEKRESDAWLPVSGAPGVEYALSRDSGGAVVWIAVRTGDRSVCVAPRLAARQLTWRIEHRTTGYDSDMIAAGFYRRDLPQFELPGDTALMGVRGKHDDALPDRWFRLDDFGAVAVEGTGEIAGYDGGEWRILRQSLD